jgi:hypothetical protein
MSSAICANDSGFDVVDVGLDGASGDDQGLGDLAVGQSLSQIGDLELSRAQRTAAAVVVFTERLGHQFFGVEPGVVSQWLLDSLSGPVIEPSRDLEMSR